MARLGGRQEPRTCAGQGHRRLCRRRYRRNAPVDAAPDRGDRGPADGRHERRRRPVRVGQDVPAAGREIGARDEEGGRAFRSEEHTYELQSLMRNSYVVLCLKKKKIPNNISTTPPQDTQNIKSLL